MHICNCTYSQESGQAVRRLLVLSAAVSRATVSTRDMQSAETDLLSLNLPGVFVVSEGGGEGGGEGGNQDEGGARVGIRDPVSLLLNPEDTGLSVCWLAVLCLRLNGFYGATGTMVRW